MSKLSVPQCKEVITEFLGKNRGSVVHFFTKSDVVYDGSDVEYVQKGKNWKRSTKTTSSNGYALHIFECSRGDLAFVLSIEADGDRVCDIEFKKKPV